MLLQFDNANDNLPNSKSLTFLDNEHLQNVDSFLDDATSVYSAPPLPSPSYDRVDSEPETKVLQIAASLLFNRNSYSNLLQSNLLKLKYYQKRNKLKEQFL